MADAACVPRDPVAAPPRQERIRAVEEPVHAVADGLHRGEIRPQRGGNDAEPFLRCRGEAGPSPTSHHLVYPAARPVNPPRPASAPTLDR